MENENGGWLVGWGILMFLPGYLGSRDAVTTPGCNELKLIYIDM